MIKYYCFAAFLLACVAFMYSDATEKVARYAAENEGLRIFNARRARRLIKPPATPREASIIQASHILGTPERVIEAIWIQENGPPDIETGSIGKTDHFAKHFPIQDWAALEAARTMNRLAFNWFLYTAEGQQAYKKMLLHAATPYVAMSPAQNARWAKNVVAFSLSKGAK